MNGVAVTLSVGGLILTLVTLLDSFDVWVDSGPDRIRVLDRVFILPVLGSIPFSYCIFLVTGAMRRFCHVRANYTRKINMFISITLSIMQKMCLKEQGDESIYTMMFPLVLYFTAIILCFLDEVQEMDDTQSSLFGKNRRVVLFFKRWMKYFCTTVMMGFERPEDTGHTVKWLVWQFMAFCLVMLPILYIFTVTMQKQELLVIPLIVTTLGDGLAEPVGVYFSTPSTRYRVPAWCYPGPSPFVRSYQGSLCVFYGALLGIIVAARLIPTTELSPDQLLFIFLTLPPIATLSEALSPHSLDNPVLMLTTSCTVLLALLF